MTPRHLSIVHVLRGLQRKQQTPMKQLVKALQDSPLLLVEEAGPALIRKQYKT